MRPTLLVLALGCALPCARGAGASAAEPAFAPADPAARALFLAQRIPLSRQAFRECRREAAEIKDPALRAAVEAQLQAPWLLPEAYVYGHPAEAEAQLKAAGLLGASEHLALPAKGKGNFASAPGGPCPSGNHAYPGGLAVHTWTTLLHARSLAADYRKVYGVELDDGWLTAAALWHDTAKAATLAWREGGTCGPEPLVAKAPLHHVLGIASAILRHLPAPLVVVIGSVRAPPSPEHLAELCGFLRAGSILALGTPDAVACPSLAAGARRPPIEAYLGYLADADAVFAAPAWAWYAAQTGTGWARFEALLQDPSDVRKWHDAQAR
ncbi:MAG: hypothetical protein NVS2B9_17400 [Myxococcales bacterium]